ncbi:MAG: nucleotidyl transferase AbiEii/AbiGii toxin family protein [Pirellulales bacterium]|nr:nucleotidyl transferase AbiEii/AbiGii toxin family protein [Pirellulales bacterium]
MTDRNITNTAASVRQKLLNLSRERSEDFGYLLSRYGTERLLFRISQSQYVDKFILKGAVLFQLWSEQPHRPTRDVDLLGYGEPSPERITVILTELCELEVEDDGLVFDTSSITAEAIKEDDEYEGIRAKLLAHLDNARISLQIDIGFGDAIHPHPEEIAYPTLLDQTAPRLKSYPRETVVAEKFQAMVMLGMANSRMKDFFDLWTLANDYAFDGSVLAEAIRTTFERRETAVPETAPLGLTDEFTENDAKLKQWSAFLLRGNVQAPQLSLGDVVALLRDFLIPPSTAISSREEFLQRWVPKGPWSRSNSLNQNKV